MVGHIYILAAITKLIPKQVDKSSRPLWSVVAILAFAPLAYINVVAAGDTVCQYT